MAEPQFGKYRLQKLIASGGMGEVFLARQEGPKGFTKPVVIKRILKHLARDRTFLDMFVNEARLAALLAHPNIAQIFELGTEQGAYFIAMEFIHGRTLRAVRAQLKEQQRTFPAGFAARISSCVLHGLHYAHTLRGDRGQPLNIIHRDVSPDNVMVGFDGSVRLLDFGIAKASNLIDTTQAGVVKGKFAYMSPEQLEGAEVDARTDVWSAGVMLYELVAGRRPFAADEDGALVKQITQNEPPPLAKVTPDAAALAPLVHRALDKNPQRRFPTAEAMAVALERYCTAAQISLGDAETGVFMRQLFGDQAAENPSTLTPSAEHSMPSSGLYLSEANAVGKTMLTAIFTAVQRMRRRAIVIGAVAAVLLLALGWGLSTIGAKRPLVVAPHVDPIAALPIEPAPKHVEFDPSAPEPEPADLAPAAEPTEARSQPDRPSPVRGGRKGMVDLRVLPWAEVFEGKKSFGITPMPPLELSAGKHTLTLKNKELKVSRQVKVKVPKDGTVTLRVDLKN